MLDPNFRKLMHPYDVANPPSGPGWVIQIVCHHYNPYPSTKQMKIPIDSPERVEFGPYQFITEKVLKKLSDPTLRALWRQECGPGMVGSGKELDHR